jgi:pSer/pThr/pTyr-binding forkhead associated (FHA) protein
VGDKFLLTDLKSKNGTFVNDKSISLHWLNHGDSITIGKHVLIFAFTEDEKRADMKDPFLGQTMVMDTDNNQDIMSHIAISTGTIARKVSK